MIKRIKKIINREKQLHPGTPGIILLGKRVIATIDYKIRNTMRNLVVSFTKDSTFKSKDEMSQCSLFPSKVLDIIINDIRPKTVLDVGCGTGVSLSYFIDNGVDATGIENSDLARSMSKYPDKIVKHNLNNEVSLHKKFDVVWCFEVIEHIHPEYENNILNTLTDHGDIIILSAAKPGQGGHGHFNEQPEEYWVEKFKHRGFNFDLNMSDRLKQTHDVCAENLMVFKRA